MAQLDRGRRRNSMNPVSAMPMHIPQTTNWKISIERKLPNVGLCLTSKNPMTAMNRGTKTPVATCRYRLLIFRAPEMSGMLHAPVSEVQRHGLSRRLDVWRAVEWLQQR
jgi:hypothetical protein